MQAMEQAMARPDVQVQMQQFQSVMSDPRFMAKIAELR